MRRAALLLVAACGSPTPTTSSPHPSASAALADASPPTPLAADRKDCLPSAESAAEIPDGGPAPAPKVVQDGILEALRLTGRRAIEPLPQHRHALWRRHRRAVLVVAKYCVDTTGHVVNVRLLQASGYTPYDDQVAREISCWTFRPLVIDGAATPACTVQTTIYRTSPPSFAPAAP